MKMKHFAHSFVETIITGSLSHTIAYADDPDSIFFDQALPIRASVDIHQAMKQGEFSDVYVRPRSSGKTPLRPVYKIDYVNDFEACNQFDDSRTLYKDILGFKLSAAIFDKDSTIDLFMDRPLSAALLRGECLLAKPIGLEAPEVDLKIAYKSKRQDHYIVFKDAKPFETISTLDLNLTIIKRVLDGIYVPPEDSDERTPLPKPDGKPVFTVTEDQIVRALTKGNETYQHVALHFLRQPLESYSSFTVDIVQGPQSSAIVNALVTHPFLKDAEEISRASVLQALANTVRAEDSARAKNAIITAMDTDFPFTMDRADRQMGARLGVNYASEGTARKGHQSKVITLGTAMLLQKMSAADRNDILARYPEAYEKLFTGTYKSMEGAVSLRKLVRGN